LIQLTQWAIVGDITEDVDVYTPPEHSRRYIRGIALNDHRHPESIRLTPGSGCNYVLTTRITFVDGNMVKTRSGTEYELLDPDPDYVQWCIDQGLHVPTLQEPLKIKNTVRETHAVCDPVAADTFAAN
jgi:hypothetical protein